MTDVVLRAKDLAAGYGGKPVVKMESFPEILGVVIVADGANNLTVKMDLLNACKVFLSIDESKIKVLST